MSHDTQQNIYIVILFILCLSQVICNILDILFILHKKRKKSALFTALKKKVSIHFTILKKYDVTYHSYFKPQKELNTYPTNQHARTGKLILAQLTGLCPIAFLKTLPR